jgi:hypothetical protein
VIPSSAVRRGVGQYAVYFLAEATASGHEERFPPTMLGAGYGFRKETIAGTRHNGREAPIAAISAIEIQGLGSLPNAP